MYFLASHANFDETGVPRHGTGSAIPAFLKDKGKEYLFIKHSLYGNSRSEIERFKSGKIAKRRVGLAKMPFLIRLLEEQLITFQNLFRHRSDIEYFIGIDPMNAFSGVIAKKAGWVKKVVFYTADFAHTRFKNPILNWAYHKIDKFAAKNADEVWNVSTRIVELRKKQGIPPSKLFLVPNTPDFNKIKRLPLSKIRKHDLVIVGNITRSINYPLIIKGVQELSKKYKDIRLKIIGSGDYLDELKELVKKKGLGKRVKLLGRKDHEDVIKILSESGVGIALYTKEKEFNQFGDSMKAREYMACGLPVIINDVPSTADDIKEKNVGFVLKGDGKDFAKVVDKLYSSDALYKKIRKAAIAYAKAYDVRTILEERFKE